MVTTWLDFLSQAQSFRHYGLLEELPVVIKVDEVAVHEKYFAFLISWVGVLKLPVYFDYR